MESAVLPTSWPLSAWHHACAGRTHHKRREKSRRSVGVVKTAFGPACILATLMISMTKPLLVRPDQPEGASHHAQQSPMERWVEEPLAALPRDFAWERFGTEERKVSWDGFISYDGVHYGLPSKLLWQGLSRSGPRAQPRAAGVRVHGQLIAHPAEAAHALSKLCPIPTNSATSLQPLRSNKPLKPLGHQITPPQVESRSLCEYDQLFGLEVNG